MGVGQVLILGKCFINLRLLRTEVERLSRIDLNSMIAKVYLLIGQHDSREARLIAKLTWTTDNYAYFRRDWSKDLDCSRAINHSTYVVKEAIAKNELFFV